MVTEKKNVKRANKLGKKKSTVSGKSTSARNANATKAESRAKSKTVTGRASIRKSPVESSILFKVSTAREVIAKRIELLKESSLNRPFIMGLIVVFFLGCLGFYYFSSSETPTNIEDGKISGQQLTEATDMQTQEAKKPAQKPVGLPKVHPIKADEILVQSVSEEPGQEIEATFGGPMEHSTKRVDSYILSVLNFKGYSEEIIEILAVEQRIRPKDSYYFQKLSVDFLEGSVYFKNPESFIQDISSGLKDLQVGAEIVRNSESHYTVSVNGLVTHELFLSFSKLITAYADTIATPGKDAMLVIMIDDIGESVEAAQALIDLDFPVTLSIWPQAENAWRCGEMGHNKGLEIMIHQPMEPMAYPRFKPGPGAIFISMSPEEITAQVRENIRMVPHAVGLNNHMGSRFTQNKEGLEAVLEAVEGENLFIVDSLTHGRSIFYDLAREKGFPTQRRDIFLDVTGDKHAILHQLRKSERLAREKGYAIAIGHPLPETLQALKEWEKTRNKNIKMVRVQDLLKYQR